MIALLSTAQIVSLIVSIGIPALSALLARGRVPVVVAGYLTPLLAAVNGVLTQFLGTPHGFDWRAAALSALMSYLVAVGAHYGWLKDSPIEAKALASGNHTRALSA